MSDKKSGKSQRKKRECRQHRELFMGYAIDEIINGTGTTEHAAMRAKKLKQVRK